MIAAPTRPGAIKLRASAEDLWGKQYLALVAPEYPEAFLSRGDESMMCAGIELPAQPVVVRGQLDWDAERREARLINPEICVKR